MDSFYNTDNWAQNVDEIGIAASTVVELVDNIESVFIKFRQGGLKLTMAECAFGHPEIEVLDRIITSKGVAPIENSADQFLKNNKLPTPVTSLQRYIGFVLYYRQYIPRLTGKLVIYKNCKLLQKYDKIEIIEVHKDAIFDINKNLASAASVSLRLLLPDKQLVIICIAIEHAAGYVP